MFLYEICHFSMRIQKEDSILIWNIAFLVLIARLTRPFN